MSGRPPTHQAVLARLLLLAVLLVFVAVVIVASARGISTRDPRVAEAINLACATYGYCETLWRKARCETAGSFSARSYNSSSGASGLFQFLPSTWQQTPYRRFSIWSPYANAMAAGWMHAHGRGSEWACR